MQGFRSPGSAQRFLSTYAAIANTFTTCRHLISAAVHRQFQAEAFTAWLEAAELAAWLDPVAHSNHGGAANLTGPPWLAEQALLPLAQSVAKQ